MILFQGIGTSVENVLKLIENVKYFFKETENKENDCSFNLTSMQREN